MSTQLAVHEAAHAVAGFLCGHPVEGVTIQPTAGAGRTTIGTHRKPTFEQALEDIAIYLIGDLAAESIPTPAILDDRCDESCAIDTAIKVSASHYETLAIVELGRARARALINTEDFKRCINVLWPRLLREQELDGETVKSICAEALTKD